MNFQVLLSFKGTEFLPQTRISHLNICAIQFRWPLIFQTMNSFISHNDSLKYWRFTPSGFKEVLEDQNLWQKISSFDPNEIGQSAFSCFYFYRVGGEGVTPLSVFTFAASFWTSSFSSSFSWYKSIWSFLWYGTPTW